MTESKKATFSAYIATPLMMVAGYALASLVFIFGLGSAEPVPVFAAFAVVSVIAMLMFALLPDKKKHIARRVNMVLFSITLVGLFGTLGRQNLQIEGLFFLTAAGVFGGATVHFLVAKILGPLVFGRAWCGWSCWTAMVLDMLPYKNGGGWNPRMKNWRYIHFGFSLALVLFLVFGVGYTIHNPAPEAGDPGTTRQMWWFIGGYVFYWVAGILMAVTMRDNRAFCKYLCPITVFLKGGTALSMLRIKGSADNCDNCGTCVTHCTVDIDIPAYIKQTQRVTSTECTMCMQCVAACPNGALKSSVGFDVTTQEKWRVPIKNAPK